MKMPQDNACFYRWETHTGFVVVNLSDQRTFQSTRWKYLARETSVGASTQQTCLAWSGMSSICETGMQNSLINNVEEVWLLVSWPTRQRQKRSWGRKIDVKKQNFSESSSAGTQAKKKREPMATSPLINWPRLFHAVVGLWCRHIRWLREKIFMELSHKPERRWEREGGRGVQERKAGETFSFSMSISKHSFPFTLSVHDKPFVAFQTAMTQRNQNTNNRKTSQMAFTQFTLGCSFPGCLSITLHKSQTHDLCTERIPQRQSPLIRLYTTTREPIAATEP